VTEKNGNHLFTPVSGKWLTETKDHDEEEEEKKTYSKEDDDDN